MISTLVQLTFPVNIPEETLLKTENFLLSPALLLSFQVLFISVLCIIILCTNILRNLFYLYQLECKLLKDMHFILSYSLYIPSPFDVACYL